MGESNYGKIKHYEMLLFQESKIRKEIADFKKSVKEYAEEPLPEGTFVGKRNERDGKADAQLITEALENLDIDWDYMIDRSQSNSDNQHRIDLENWGEPWR